MKKHDLSLAQPKRLFIDRDDDGTPHHVLAGDRIEPGTMLLLQLADQTWIPGFYEWDGAVGPEHILDPPRFRLILEDPYPDEKTRPPLVAEFYLPPDAVLRVHPKWTRMMNPPAPRPNRQPRTRRHVKP